MGVHTHYEDNTYPNLYRIIVDRVKTTVNFSDSELQSKYGGDYDPGDIIEFESTKNFTVNTFGPDDNPTGKIQLAEFFVGQKYSTSAASDDYNGDPSVMFSVPAEQFRTEYIFLTPLTYLEEWASVIAKTGTSVTIDDKEVTGWQSISGSEYQVANFKLGEKGEAGRKEEHHASSDQGFGILIYGMASYTSYMYPGGLNLIPVIIKD